MNTSDAETTYTDRDIDEQRQRLAELERAAADTLAPQPRRERAAAQATRIRTTIRRHEQTRPPGGS